MDVAQSSLPVLLQQLEDLNKATNDTLKALDTAYTIIDKKGRYHPIPKKLINQAQQCILVGSLIPKAAKLQKRNFKRDRSRIRIKNPESKSIVRPQSINSKRSNTH